MNDLQELLNRATDRVQSPDLAATALAVARRRRTTHRSALAAGVAAIVVLGVAVAGQLNLRENDNSVPVTPPTTTTATTIKTPKTTDLAQAPWNPRDVDDLPQANLAVGLPDVVNPPLSATPLAADPVNAAVLCFAGTNDVLLLATDGTWRSVPMDSDYGGAELTTDGTRLAVATQVGVDIWDLRTGEQTTLANPDGYNRSEYPPTWVWINNATLLFDDAQPGGWLVDTASSQTTRVPYPINSLATTVDADGVVIQSSTYGDPAQLVDWDGGQPRRVDMTGIDRLSTISADADTVAGTSGASVVVADRADLTLRYVLPLVDPQANYADGKLPVVALLDDGTVLLQVPVFDREFSWRLVAWEPETSQLTRIVTGIGPVPRSYATGLFN